MAERRIFQIKVALEQHKNSWVAYPIGMKGVVVGQGDTRDKALEDIRSAIQFHLETFGPDAFFPDESDSE